MYTSIIRFHFIWKVRRRKYSQYSIFSITLVNLYFLERGNIHQVIVQMVYTNFVCFYLFIIYIFRIFSYCITSNMVWYVIWIIFIFIITMQQKILFCFNFIFWYRWRRKKERKEKETKAWVWIFSICSPLTPWKEIIIAIFC